MINIYNPGHKCNSPICLCVCSRLFDSGICMISLIDGGKRSKYTEVTCQCPTAKHFCHEIIIIVI